MPKSNGAQKTKGMQYAKDEFGKDILLKDGNLQVIMEWEKPYMEACIEALNPKGDVLEVGFGLGYSASQIQKHHPKSHTIIECDPIIAKKAREWAKKQSNVTIIENTWQAALPQLKQYDAIFFNAYTPLSDEELKQISEEAQEYRKMAQETKLLKDAISANLKRYKGIKFSDEEVGGFAIQVLKQRGVSSEDVIEFIDNLEEWGNITNHQKASFLRQFEKGVKKGGAGSQIKQIKQIPTDLLIYFTEAVLDQHLKHKGRFSAYFGSPETKARHKGLQERILSRKDLSFTEKVIPVHVPNNCRYYEGNQAIILVIEKK